MRRAFAPFDRAALDEDPSTVIGVAPDLSIAYLNPAYWAFARANGARWGTGEWGIGASLMAAVPPVLSGFYTDLFERARGTRQIVEHEYACASPDRERRFRLRVMPCEGEELLVVHSLVHEAPHGTEGASVLEAHYGRNGVVTQCSHCRRVRRNTPPYAWDWVPALVENPPANVSHGLCPPCVAYHYGGDDG
ncbi:MAG: hypothetical protein U0414_42565 [Polyangiaceae bacterium]